MGKEVVREVKIGESSLEVRTSDMILIEEETKVRLHGVFRISKPCREGEAVWGILEAFGLLDVLVKKEWMKWEQIDGKKDLRSIVPLKKRNLEVSDGGVVTIDFTIGTEI